MAGFWSRTTPTLSALDLSEDEQLLIRELEMTGQPDAADMELSRLFYLGMQVIKNLRIAIPRELEPYLTTVLGWGATAVDPLVERLALDGFRTPDSDDADEYVSDLLAENGFEAELSVAITDALSMRHAYFTVGSSPDGGSPLVTVDSPLSMFVKWDLRGLNPIAGLRKYEDGGVQRAALIKPRETVSLAVDDKGRWVVANRDRHDYDFVPITRMANMPLSDARHGRSEITPALRSLITDASRQMRALAIAGELYSVPQKLILGATEEAFQKADGSKKSALETYITSVLALERDENGELPDVKQMQVYDPTAFTKVIDMYAAQASGLLAAVPQDLGLYTEGNPPSAEAVNAAESRRDRRAILRQRYFSPALAKVAQHVIRFDNEGKLPSEYRRLTPDWLPVAQEPFMLASQGVQLQVQSGSVSPTSDVVLKRLGYNAVERRRLAADMRRDRVTQAAAAARQTMQEAASAESGIGESDN